MAFHETAIFPEDISYNSRGGPGFFTGFIEGEGGSQQRIARWSQTRHRYDVKYGIKSINMLRSVKTFYLCRLGCAYGFRYKDWFDFSTASDHHSAPSSTDQSLGSGNGSTTTFQLRKVYSQGGFNFIRVLTKPIVGSVVVSVNNVLQTSGYTVDTTLGVITFTTAPGIGLAVKAGCYFHVPVSFAKEVDEVLSMNYDDFDIGNIPSIPLVELMDPTPVPRTTTEPGGSTEICPEAIPTLNLSARLWVIDTTHVNECVLPDLANVPMGGPIFYILNIGPDDLTVRITAAGTVLVTIPAGEASEFLCSIDYTGTRSWVAF